MQDTWGYQASSIQEYHLLFEHPHDYFTNLFMDPYEEGVSKFFDSNDSYWNDLKGNVFIKILSVFNILGQKVYSMPININNGSSLQNVALNKQLAKGLYTLQITNGFTFMSKQLLLQ